MQERGYIYYDIFFKQSISCDFDSDIEKILRINSKHIQLDEANVLVEQINSTPGVDCKQLKDAINLQHDLEKDDWKYSNDLMTGMIISKVVEWFNLKPLENPTLKHILENNIYVIKNMYSNQVNAFVQEYQGKCRVVIHKSLYNFLETLSHLSGILVIKSLCNDFQENYNLSLRLEQLCVKKLTALYRNEISIAEKADLEMNLLVQENEFLKYKNYEEYYGDKYVQITNEVFEICVAFILGHEIGHYYHRHTGTKDSNLSHRQEMDADRFGIGFCLNYISACGTPKTYQHLGIILAQIGVLLYINCIDNYSNSHPTIRVRITQIIENFPKFSLRQSSTEIMDLLFDLTSSLIRNGFSSEPLNELNKELEALANPSQSNKDLEDFVDIYFSRIEKGKIPEAKGFYNELIMELQKKDVNINIIAGIKCDMLQITMPNYKAEVNEVIDTFLNKILK